MLSATSRNIRIAATLKTTQSLTAILLHRTRSVSSNNRNVGEVFSQKPDVELVRAQDTAHEEIIRAVVPVVGGGLGRLPDFPDHDLVGLEQPRELNGRLLPATGRPGNAGGLGDIGGHRDAEASERLDSRGDVVDELHLLLAVFVEEPVKLMEGPARELPVVLLVEVAERHRIGENLIQVLHAVRGDRSDGLDVRGPLTSDGYRPAHRRARQVSVDGSRGGLPRSGTHYWVPFGVQVPAA